MPFEKIARGAMALALGAVLALPLAAQEFPAPTGEVILTVSGQITGSQGAEGVAFDMSLLETLGAEEISTSTIWTEGVHSFTGVSLKVLADKLGVTEGTLKMTAINDYMVEVPVADAVEGGPILAYLMDGQPMSVVTRGPSG